MRQRLGVFWAFAIAARVASHRLRSSARHSATVALICGVLLAGTSSAANEASCSASGSPNGEGQVVVPGQTVSGTISSGEDRISYLICLCVGQSVVVEARATEGNLIPLIAAYNPDGEYRSVWTASRDDVEIRQAIEYWILGQAVPGIGQTIDDPTIRQLIQIWILGEPVSAAATALG